MIAVAAASGAMAVTIPAYAGSAADGSAAGSPGVISGNTVQVPVHIPLNVCGNTVNVAGLLNPAAGNICANEDSADAKAAAPAPGGASARDGAVAHGTTANSPGVVSGNVVQLPVHLPVNVSGNTVNGVGVGNAAVGNKSTNTYGDAPATPSTPVSPVPVKSAPPKAHQAPAPAPHDLGEPVSLAHTGMDQTLPALAGGAALVLGGAALYRRFRPRAEY
ncbi:chaplin family protein [Streptomyces sp. NPDC001315]|uniref:chaplin family protein n=1 Tax=Streptomyces sp. NPDC001315 TaxID=3364562 RepID=UPI0036AA168D